MGQPVTLTRTPSTIARAAPKRGEHTEEILSEAGYSKEELARMKSSGVF
jgi:formyl-CoA transferase